MPLLTIGFITNTRSLIWVDCRKVGQDAGPEIHITHPKLLFYVAAVHVSIDFYKLVSSGRECWPWSRNAQISCVRVSGTIIRKKKMSGIKWSVSVVGKGILCCCYTPSWQSWSSRRSCIQKRHGGEASIPVGWRMAFRRHTASHQHGQLQASWGRVWGGLPDGWAQRTGTNRCDQFFSGKLNIQTVTQNIYKP